MKQPEDMSLTELRTELRQLGVTERLSTLILREMGAAERRIEETKKTGTGGKSVYDPMRAQLYVLKAHGMTSPDLSLNRKGLMFISLTTREEVEAAAAQSA